MIIIVYRCLCKCCKVMEKVDECTCCLEILKMADRVTTWNTDNVPKPISCIPEHPGFIAGCLNIWALKIAYHQYKQEHTVSDIKKKSQHE